MKRLSAAKIRRNKGAWRDLSENSVLAQQADEPALHLHPVGREDARIVSRVCRLEGYRIAAFAQALQAALDVEIQRANIQRKVSISEIADRRLLHEAQKELGQR